MLSIRKHPVVVGASILAVYAWVIHRGVDLTVPSMGVSALWLANGVAMATLVRRPKKHWLPGLLLFGIVNIGIRLAKGFSLGHGLAFVVGDTIDVLLAMLVLRTLLGRGSTFERPYAILALFSAAVVGAAASSIVVINNAHGMATSAAPNMHSAVMWFIGRTLGEVLIVLLVDAWRAQDRNPLGRRRSIQAVLVVSAVVLTGGVGHAVPQAGTLLAVAIGAVRSFGLLLCPIMFGRRASATMIAIIVFEYASLMVIGRVAILGVDLVVVGSPDQLALGLGVTEVMLSLLTTSGLILGLAALMAERHQTAVVVKEEHARFRAITDAAVDGVIEVDPTGVIVFANEAAATLFATDSLLGCPVEEFLEIPEAVKRAVGGDERGREALLLGLHADTVGIRPGGRKFSAEASWWCYLRPASFGVMVIVRDSSTRQEAAQQLQRQAADLERSNKDLAEFAYIASHDLQEPLRMVASFLRLLSDRYGDKLDDDAEQYITYAMEGAERLSALVADLLSYSRAGTIALDDSTLALSVVAQESLDLLRIPVRESKARVMLGDLPIVRGNRSLMGQVFQNLILNSLKFCPEDESPRLEITSRSSPSGPVVCVVDHGIGISDADRDVVFQPFRRLHVREKFPGNGIGLAVCRKIVERHSGRIWIEPTEGGGTTVCLQLPEVRVSNRIRGVA